MGMYDVFKDAISMAQKADNIDLVKTILSLQQEMLKIQEENTELIEENKKLKNVIEDIKKVEFKNNSYYFENEGPYCTKCYDDEKKKIRMLEEDNNMGVIYLVCPKCKTRVFAREGKSKMVSMSNVIEDFYK